MNNDLKVGDKVFSCDKSREGIVIEIKNNPFHGVILLVRFDDCNKQWWYNTSLMFIDWEQSAGGVSCRSNGLHDLKSLKLSKSSDEETIELYLDDEGDYDE